MRKNNRVIQLKVSDDLFERFDKFTKDNGYNKTKLITILIERYMKEENLKKEDTIWNVQLY